jgi:uncharacterized 2Fe-2S/4Fe-4S cluster protein (DUF4445 family)
MVFLGIDVGGSSIKAAPVDIKSGELVAEALAIKTPQLRPMRSLTPCVSSRSASTRFRVRSGLLFRASCGTA